MDWISIDDKLPEEGQAVIYWFKETGVSRGKYTSKAFGNGIMDVFYGANGWLGDDVEFWMPDEGQPLPEPPEEGE